MTRRLLPVVLAVLALPGCGGGQSAVGSSETAAPEPLDGEAILQRTCTACHSLRALPAYAPFWGEPEWRSMVETMIGYGALLEPGEFEVLVRYLGETY